VKGAEKTEVKLPLYDEVTLIFIIKLNSCFKNERKIFFVLDYCPGGELFRLLQKKKKFSENQILFYSA
jgi:serum/glucocorticoid-regulated kinase 2